MNLRETYNAIAEPWHRTHQTDSWWIEGMDRFISKLAPGSAVLDVGCAAGMKSRYLMERGMKVTGIDFSEKFIEIAKRELSEGRFLVLDLFDVNALPDAFDGIVVPAVLLHVPKTRVRTAVEGIVQRLKSGGYIYIAVKERAEHGPEEDVIVEEIAGMRCERFFSFFNVGEIDGILTSLGLEIVSSEVLPSGHTRWIQIIGKKP